MNTIILVIHLIVALILIGLILLQTNKGGLGSAFGGNQFYRSKRGAERIVFVATIATSVLFLITSVSTLFFR